MQKYLDMFPVETHTITSTKVWSGTRRFSQYQLHARTLYPYYKSCICIKLLNLTVSSTSSSVTT